MTPTAESTTNNRAQKKKKREFSHRRKHTRVNITEELNTELMDVAYWGGLLALVYTTATNKISLNFLIGLARLIRPPCRVQMVTVTE